MQRRQFLKKTAGLGLLSSAIVSTGCESKKPSLDKVRDDIAKMRASSSVSSTIAKTPAEVFTHCAQSIECSLSGFPDLKPAWIRNTVGQAVFHAFSAMGHMKHDVTAPIPGLENAPAEADLASALNRLEAAFAKLAEANTFSPHFFYGDLSKDDVFAAQIMHFNNHMENIVIA